MGFPIVCYCLAVPKPLIAFFKLLNAVREALLLMLAVVGISQPPQGGQSRGGGGPAADAPLPEEVKARLPAVEYAQVAAELLPPAPSCPEDHGGEAAATCIVCLERLGAADEVRRLGNCAHAFHRGCIDRWIDLGRLTCPLCRSHLLPRRRRSPLGWGRVASLLTRVS